MIKSNKYYSLERSEVAAFVPQNIRTILDVGCSQGHFLELIKKSTQAETWGIEVEENVAEEAKKRVDNVICANVENSISNLPENYFDCITFNDVLEHLIFPEKILAMIRSKLSESGLIIASISNVRYFEVLI